MQDVEKLKAFRDKGCLRQAIEYSQKFNIEKKNAAFISVLAHIYLIMDQIDKAKKLLELAFNKDSNSALVIWNYTRVYLKEKKYNEALKNVTLGLQKYQNDLEGLSVLSTCLMVNNKYADSKTLCNRILEIDEKNIEANLNLGLMNLSLKFFDEAQNHLEIVYNQRPHLHQIWPLLGSLYLQKENYKKAITLYLKLIIKDNLNIKFLYSIAYCYEKLGKLDESIIYYKKIENINNYNPEILNKIGVLYERSNKIILAKRYLIAALKVKPDYLEAHINISKLHYKKGEIKESVKKHNYILQKDKTNIESIFNLISLNTQIFMNKKKFFGNQKMDEINFQSLQNESKSIVIQLAINEFINGNINKTKNYIKKFANMGIPNKNDFDQKEEKFNNAYFKLLSKLLEISISNNEKNICKIYHIGESHCLSYAYKKINIKSKEFSIQPLITFGCKAFHIANKKKNQYKTFVENNLISLPNNSKVFISFGEIDCRHDEGFIPASFKLNKSFSELVPVIVKDFLNFFKEKNKIKKHDLYFFNVPAPILLNDQKKYLNDKVAKLIELYNRVLSIKLIEYGFKLIDVYNLTKDSEGYSNQKFHIDLIHLHPKILNDIKIN